jgi:flavodoxin
MRKELAVTALVVYESMYGNTHALAEAIAEGLGHAELAAVHDAPKIPGADLVVVGGPTHVHGMASARTRVAAVRAVRDAREIDPQVAIDLGLREWLRQLPPGAGTRAAAFDTRLDKPAWVTGAASHGIAKRLRQSGYDVVATQSFLVTDSEGPLVDGELERARQWGRQLAASLRTAVGV